MANVVIPYTFSPATLAQSAQVDANFTAIANYENGGNGSFAANGYAYMPGGLLIQWASIASVAFDGAALTAVVFPIAFPTACFVVIPSIKNVYQTNPWAMTIQFDTPTVTGFNVNVAGAPASSTGTIAYIALGN